MCTAGEVQGSNTGSCPAERGVGVQEGRRVAAVQCCFCCQMDIHLASTPYLYATAWLGTPCAVRKTSHTPSPTQQAVAANDKGDAMNQ